MKINQALSDFMSYTGSLVKSKKKVLFALALLVTQIGVSTWQSQSVSADTIAEYVNVPGEYVKVLTSTGVHDTGQLVVKSNGKEEVAFCIEPEVLIPLGMNTGYIGKDRTDLSARAEQIATLWSTVSTDKWYYFVAQTMIWEAVNGIEVYGIDGFSDSDFQNAKAQINQAVDNYNKKPSFNGQTVTVKLGESVTLTDTNNTNLSEFNSLTPSSNANVDYSINGNQLTITPNKNSNENGKFRLMKTLAQGTSVVYQKSGSQTLMVAKINDPNYFDINIKVVKTGKSQVQKLDEETGKPMANVQFKMTVDGKDYDVKTNDKGIGFIDKEFLHDTEVTYTEVKTLDGYVLNETPIKAKIKAGETITLSMNNEAQKGRVKGHKDKEVYNASESEKQGKSVYDKVPLSNVTFDVVAQNDITRPDGETVLKKGEAADTFTTNENGDFESTKDIYIGNQNTYKLVERDVPENYRPLYDNQATFTIPYDSTNKTKVFTLDMGTLDNDLKTGTFNLEKVDSETGKVIPNTQFLLRGLSTYNKDVLYTITTVDSATIDKLIAGKYEVVEVKYSDGYTQNESETLTKIIEIKDGETTKVIIKNNKIDVKNPKTTIKTKAHLEDGSQYFTAGDTVNMYDDVEITHEDILDGTDRAFETILVAKLPDGTEKDIWKSGKIDYKVSDSQLTKTVVTEKVDTGAYPKGTTFYFKEIGYDKDGNKDTEHNFDGKDQEQGIYPKETPESSLPTMNESSNIVLVGGGILLLAVVTGVFLLKKKYHNNKNIS
ncbi:MULTISPECIES: SpaA isopeptide-forming pilin-related protein [unclassified Enterococcus]|uniref:MSCRAMM family protein n=1 Tax=unclassified Enterococcus TaxID=2608891 RepID=UPI001553BC6E|nr:MULTISPECIES: SpaA isopeptide-forming pilin-related protein [unclassified Enterococcus]MBS7576955.1 hypothetical protein [Enterococcus sp. MMGLQ5-2]MBS7584362.1 hypothetical protein [Enterococcus sp. MMGLQ5-1]NPD12217.1 hypothetical protein [Enterococcus sp. MMGLQ5-1]NPD36789.1 hypothetical protein [Enterococcus sp. MMGLQ5-2]